MEQNQNNQNQHAYDANQQQYNREFALQAHIMHQGQSINRLHGMLNSSSFVRGFKTVVSVLMEIFMYLLFTWAIILIIIVPIDYTFDQQVNQDISVSSTIHSNNIAGIIISCKIAIFFISLSFLLCAILLRRNRKKSSLIGRAYRETETLKKNFDQAMQLFRF
jgi:hypothetical protein